MGAAQGTKQVRRAGFFIIHSPKAALLRRVFQQLYERPPTRNLYETVRWDRQSGDTRGPRRERIATRTGRAQQGVDEFRHAKAYVGLAPLDLRWPQAYGPATFFFGGQVASRKNPSKIPPDFELRGLA